MVQALRNHFNIALENALVTKNSHFIADVDVHNTQFDGTNYLTEDGRKCYWRSLDATLRRFDANDKDTQLLPTRQMHSIRHRSSNVQGQRFRMPPPPPMSEIIRQRNIGREVTRPQTSTRPYSSHSMHRK